MSELFRLPSSVKNAMRSFSALSIQISGRDRRIIRHYLRNASVRKLQIGCGKNPLRGWLNTNFPLRLDRRTFEREIICLDAARPFPFPDDSFAYIKTEHMIEHVPHGAGQFMLRECFRTLKPGGRIRVSTPDLAFLVDLLRNPTSEHNRAYLQWAGKRFLGLNDGAMPAMVVNHFVRSWGHQFIYDRTTLLAALHDSGFREIERHGINESGDPNLAQTDFPERLPANFLELETMTYEALKPRR